MTQPPPTPAAEAAPACVHTAPRVLLGVSGGIAAYKTPSLVRRLRDAGCTVQVVMTAAATAFITPLTLQAVSGQPVRTALLDPAAETGMDHIALARWADLVLVAPATAHVIARLAHGLADDLLTTLCLASATPLLLAPAMNQQMWQHPATQANLALLTSRGARLIGPGSGAQACGESGPGRMLEPDQIADALLAAWAGSAPPAGLLAGRRVLLTAGPTREPIDPVRFVGNRSSGKMGLALASALQRAGAMVTIIAGPVALPDPAGCVVIRVETALEMAAAVTAQVGGCDLFIAAAAVADYRPEAIFSEKLKKDADTLTLRLVRNPDILAGVAALPGGPFTVGFAAETGRVAEYAAAKLAAKGLDLIAANQVGAGLGFETDDNALLVLWPGGQVQFPMMAKARLADALVQLIADRYAAFIAG